MLTKAFLFIKYKNFKYYYNFRSKNELRNIFRTLSALDLAAVLEIWTALTHWKLVRKFAATKAITNSQFGFSLSYWSVSLPTFQMFFFCIENGHSSTVWLLAQSRVISLLSVTVLLCSYLRPLARLVKPIRILLTTFGIRFGSEADASSILFIFPQKLLGPINTTTRCFTISINNSGSYCIFLRPSLFP